MGEAYRTMYKRLCRFYGKEPTVDDIFCQGNLHRFQQQLFAEKLKVNTVVFYNAILRIVYNQMMKKKLVGKKKALEMPDASELFENLCTKRVKTEKRALSLESIAKLIAADLSDNPKLEEARDIFLLSVFLQGMPYIDLLHLRKSDLQGSVIRYRRKKTDSPITVAVLPLAAKLLSKYTKPNTMYMLPYVTKSGIAGKKQYDNQLHYYNDALKALAKRLGIKEKISSYSGRHSWATIAHLYGVDISIISQGMGHQTEEITHTYLADFDHETLMLANETVMATSLELIFSGQIAGISPARMAELEQMRDENIRNPKAAAAAGLQKPKEIPEIILDFMSELEGAEGQVHSEEQRRFLREFQVMTAERFQFWKQQGLDDAPAETTPNTAEQKQADKQQWETEAEAKAEAKAEIDLTKEVREVEASKEITEVEGKEVNVTLAPRLGDQRNPNDKGRDNPETGKDAKSRPKQKGHPSIRY